MTDIERQIQIEADAVHEGVLKYFQGQKYRQAADSRAGSDLIANSLWPLALKIERVQIGLAIAEDKKLPQYGLAILAVRHEPAALITLGVMLNTISRSEFEDGLPPSVTSVAYEIGQRYRLERIFDLLRERGVDVAWLLSHRNDSRHAARRANQLAQKVDDPADWSKNFRSYHLGEKLIALAVRIANLGPQKPVFEFKTIRDSTGKTTRCIALTDAASDWIAAHTDDLTALTTPVYRPMIVEPRPWTSLSEGGYLATPMNLLKRPPGKWAQELLNSAGLLAVFSALNAIQNTGWRINEDMLGIMRNAWDAGYPLFGLDRHTLERLPPKLPDDADPKEIKKRKQERAGAFNLNSRIKGLNQVMSLRLALAEWLRDIPRFYFPHQLDHRGRAYPVPQLINPQSDDSGRALLEFDEGKPLGPSGVNWLAIHIANCYGKNKVSFEERLAWVHEREKGILAFAEDPQPAHPFWKEADDPWMFLRACKDWKGCKEQGFGFISHLPISMDGTCNGYQHLSAMGRDPVGGSATNLTPSDKPADIYQRVADRVILRLKFIASEDGENAELAREFLDKINRTVVKHATMTTPYGVTLLTIYKVLLMSEPAKSCKDPKKSAMYLAKVLVECIPEVAVEAGKIMTWLRNVAGILAKANQGMAWTTPMGFPVVHANREARKPRVKTADRSFVVYLEDETQKISRRKQTDGVVAHFVHSMDATHMMRTVNRLWADGILHYAMVHDSYGVHAGDVDTLNRILREEFLGIYSEPVLQNFLDELRKANPGIRLPDVPLLGDLDIRQVLQSLYFFA